MTRQSTASLSHLTLLEFECNPAGAFAGAVLADFGINAIVCEPPQHGSLLRRLGPQAVQDVWWRILARNKRSIALDPANAHAAPVVRRLVETASIVVDDNAGILDNPWSQAAAMGANRPIGLHLYPSGADDPKMWGWSTRAELVAAATGMMAVTGWAGGEPVQPEFPLVEHTAGLMGAASALFELRAAANDQRPPADLFLATHEMMLRMNEWQLVVASAVGEAEQRIGNRLPMNTNVGSIFETADGKLLTVSAATQSVIERLIRMVGGEEAAADPRFRTLADRKQNMDALEDMIAGWMKQHSAADAMQQVQAHDVVAGPIFDTDDLLASEQVAARNNIAEIDGPAGSLPMPAALPLMHGIDMSIRGQGRDIGADSDEILAEIGFTVPEIRELRATGAIWA